MYKLVAIVGMPGSGKSEAAAFFKQAGLPVIRFGEIIVKEVESRGLEVTPTNERMIREELRTKFGMDVCAKLAIPNIMSSLQKNQLVVIDGLYSFTEYKTLRHNFNKELFLVAVFTPKAQRYQRLGRRPERPLTYQEAEERDYMEIERIEKGGPIAIADVTIINDGTKNELFEKLNKMCMSYLEAFPDRSPL